MKYQIRSRNLKTKKTKKLKNKIYFKIIVLVILAGFLKSYAQKNDNQAIDAMLNNWHKAATESNFNAYFEELTDDSVFIGTDATEVWNKSEFMAFSKPYFDKGKAWDFKSLERHIYIDKSGKIAWFDELLNTWMKICRGSGVLEKVNGQWKIKQYVLSMTIPNDDTNAVIKIITPAEDALIEKIGK